MNTFISNGGKTLGAKFKSDYMSARSGGKEAAVNNACSALMEKLESDLLFECDYYIYFDKTSLTDLSDLLGGIEVKIPFEMRFSDASVIRQGDTKLTGDQLWKAMSYGSYASGCELNAAKLLWTAVFNKLKASISSDMISLFILDLRANLYTSIPKTNGVDIFFLRNFIALEDESYQFSSADMQAIAMDGATISIVCKIAFWEKMNTFLKIYEQSVELEDIDKNSAFNDIASQTISSIYNSVTATLPIYSTIDVKTGSLYIVAK